MDHILFAIKKSVSTGMESDEIDSKDVEKNEQNVEESDESMDDNDDDDEKIMTEIKLLNEKVFT